MILVDIGNSGLRAARSRPSLRAEDPSLFEIPKPIYKLSWSSIGQQIGKQRPDPTHSEHRRWIQIDDPQGYDWLLQSVLDGESEISVQEIRIASVNRNALDSLLKSIERYASAFQISIVPRIVDYRDVGNEVAVDYPQKVGIDRVLAARAAVERTVPGVPVIVVQAGTALTVDWVDHRGHFQGGAILPGVGLALQYLAAGTDQLPWLPTDSIDRLPRLPGKNTEEAIAAGVHASLVGGVRYLVDRYRQEIGGRTTVPVVISGGDGRLVREHIAEPAAYVEDLVLIGLALSDPQ